MFFDVFQDNNSSKDRVDVVHANNYAHCIPSVCLFCQWNPLPYSCIPGCLLWCANLCDHPHSFWSFRPKHYGVLSSVMGLGNPIGAVLFFVLLAGNIYDNWYV